MVCASASERVFSGEAVTFDEYLTLLKQASAAKLRATGTMAEYADRNYEAAVLFHEAERLTRTARSYLDHTSTDAVANDVERCCLLLDGFDPWGAKIVWDAIPSGARNHPFARRLETRLRKALDEAAKRLRSATNLMSAALRRTVVPATRAEQVKALAEAQRLLRRYPGVRGFWWISYRLLHATEDYEGGWRALTHGDALDPESGSFRAMALALAPRYLSQQAARAYVDAVGEDITDAPPVVVLHYALAELSLDPGPTSPGLQRAAQAIPRAIPRTVSAKMRTYLEVTSEILARRRMYVPVSVDMLVNTGFAAPQDNEFSEAKLLHELVDQAVQEIDVPLAA